VLVPGLVALAGCGGGSAPESNPAHVNEASGSVNGAVLDERAGTKPAPTPKVGLAKAAEDAGCYLLRKVPANNDKVVSLSGPSPEYEREPPVVGAHVAPPHQQADGAYLTLPDERTTVASLDHGRMTIQYAPDLPEAAQLGLKGLYDTMYGGTLFFPNDSMRYAVAATTWSNGLFCTGYEREATLEAIRAFGEATWGRYGDAPVEKFPVKGPTPTNPRKPHRTANG
jgi:hypothetical protein